MEGDSSSQPIIDESPGAINPSDPANQIIPPEKPTGLGDGSSPVASAVSGTFGNITSSPYFMYGAIAIVALVVLKTMR